MDLVVANTTRKRLWPILRRVHRFLKFFPLYTCTLNQRLCIFLSPLIPFSAVYPTLILYLQFGWIYFHAQTHTRLSHVYLRRGRKLPGARTLELRGERDRAIEGSRWAGSRRANAEDACPGAGNLSLARWPMQESLPSLLPL